MSHERILNLTSGPNKQANKWMTHEQIQAFPADFKKKVHNLVISLFSCLFVFACCSALVKTRILLPCSLPIFKVDRFSTHQIPVEKAFIILSYCGVTVKKKRLPHQVASVYIWKVFVRSNIDYEHLLCKNCRSLRFGMRAALSARPAFLPSSTASRNF